MVRASKLGMDPEKVKNGVWFDYALARWRLRPHSMEFELVVLQYLQSLGVADLHEATPEQQGAATARGIADALLTDWDKLEDENDTPIPFSADAAFDLLRDPGCEDIRRQLVTAARLRSRYQSLEADLAAKN